MRNDNRQFPLNCSDRICNQKRKAILELNANTFSTNRRLWTGHISLKLITICAVVNFEMSVQWTEWMKTVQSLLHWGQRMQLVGLFNLKVILGTNNNLTTENGLNIWTKYFYFFKRISNFLILGAKPIVTHSELFSLEPLLASLYSLIWKSSSITTQCSLRCLSFEFEYEQGGMPTFSLANREGYV